MQFQMDGSPTYFHSEFCKYVHCRNQWNRRNGFQNLPGSDDSRFFLWGYITPLTTPDNLKQRIRQAFLSSMPHMLAKVDEVLERGNVCF